MKSTSIIGAQILLLTLNVLLGETNAQTRFAECLDCIRQRKNWNILKTKCNSAKELGDIDTMNACSITYRALFYNQEKFVMKSYDDISKLDGRVISMVRSGIV